MSTCDQAAIADLGLALIHPELRRYWTVLSSVGAQQLRLSNLVSALEARGYKATGEGGELLRGLWSATDLLIETSTDKTGLPSLLAKLKAVPFMLDIDNKPIEPMLARRLPPTVSAATLQRLVPDRRVVHSHILALPHITNLVSEYLLDDLAADLATTITDEASANAVIGDSDEDVRRLYTLLTSFPTDRKSGAVADALSDVPILRTGIGFVSPSRAQLPGDFRDPIGHFKIVETRFFVDGMRDFACEVLRVNVLTFRDYVEKHLEEIFAGELSKQQYGTLLTEFVNHRFQLDEDGTLKVLAKIAFIRTRAGKYARPNEVYFWSAPLASILGEDPARWIDETWLPSQIAPRARDLFERLGMPITVAAEHIVERIKIISENSDLDGIVAKTTPIIRHVLERWSHFDERERISLRELREVHFLAATVDGVRKDGVRYSPRDVYRAGRAAGFASQVPVVEMVALRQSTQVVADFLDLVGVPAEPETDKIVAHLEHCMNVGASVNDLTYQMLNERIERADNAGCIDRLAGTNFISIPGFGFIGASEVFWLPPPFGRHWHTASPRMRQREQLYRRLGVVDSPEPRHFAALAVQIAGSPSRSSDDVIIHGRCLAALAEALDRDDVGASDAVDLLVNQKAFLSINDVATLTRDAIWLDSEQLAGSFGSVLDERLVRLTDVGRSAAIRFLHRLEVPALTDIARFRLAEEPDKRIDTEATSQLQSQADLILWLAPNHPSRQALRKLLNRLEIRFSDQLLVQAEIDAFDPPVRSPASSAPAYFDQEAGLLHLRSAKDRVDWATAFRTLFAEVERFCPTADVPPLCMTAAYIMSLDDRADAEQALRASDFKAPGDYDDLVEPGEELRDEPEEAEAEEVENGIIEDGRDEEVLAQDDSSPDEDTSKTRSGNGATRNDIANRAAGGRQDTSNEPGSHDGKDRDEDKHDDVVFDDEAYGSAPTRGAFGAGPIAPTTAAGIAGSPGERGGAQFSGEPRGAGTSKLGSGSKSETMEERQVRRSRMLSYVSRLGVRGDGDAKVASTGDDISDLIDIEAMKAALNYEKSRGWDPEQQPHFNPGVRHRIEIAEWRPSSHRGQGSRGPMDGARNQAQPCPVFNGTRTSGGVLDLRCRACSGLGAPAGNGNRQSLWQG